MVKLDIMAAEHIFDSSLLHLHFQEKTAQINYFSWVV